MRSLRLFLIVGISLTSAVCSFIATVPRESRENLFSESEAQENPAARIERERRMLCDPTTGMIPDNIRQQELAFASTLPTRESLYKRSGLQNFSWTQMGPYNIGGRTRAFAVDVSGEDTMLAGGASGGMWRSTDGGKSWVKTSTNSQIPVVSCLAQDKRPGKTNVWYFGTGELLGASQSGDGAYFSGDGIFKSIDNGKTWTQLPSTASNTPASFDKVTDFIWRIVTTPSGPDSSLVFAATYGTIIRSTNGGTSWATALTTSNNNYSYYTDVASTSNGVVYAGMSSEGGRGGIWRTVNGSTWSKITPSNFPTLYKRIVLSTAPSDSNVLYVLAETPGFGHLGRGSRGDSSYASLWKYTYVSGDGTGAGGIWEDRSANLPSLGKSFGDFYLQFGYDQFVRVKPDDANTVFIGGTNIYRSTDGFSTRSTDPWIGGYADSVIKDFQVYPVNIMFSYPEHHPDQHDLVFSPTNPNIAYSANDGGVFKTTNVMAPNVVWESLNNGYTVTQFYTVAIDHQTVGSNVIIGGLQDQSTWMTRSTDPIAPWKQISGSNDGSYCAIFDNGTMACISKQEGRVYRAKIDGNGNLSEYTNVTPIDAKGFDFINPFMIDPNNSHRMYLLGGSYMWRNSDFTAVPYNPDSMPKTTINWQQLSNTVVTDSISAFDVSTIPANRVYYGTNHGRLFKLENAHTGDPTPVEITGSNFPKNAHIVCVAVDPRNADNVMVVFSNYSVVSLFYTTNAGGSWNAVAGNLEQNANGSGSGPSCRWAKIIHHNNGTIWLVGTSTGLYSTELLDSMKTVWALEGPNTIGNAVVTMIDQRPSDGFTAVATHGSGMFTGTLPLLDVQSESSTATSLVQLFQNTPNPASGITQIRYSIPTALSNAPVQLDVLDMTGKFVLSIPNAPKGFGDHTLDLNISSLVPGNYFYRLRIRGTVTTRTMTVLR